MIVTTMGVYGKTEEEFFSTLLSEKIDVFVDVRQRRGVRGKKYSFVNSSYLQKKLNELGVDYLYLKDLSPTQEIRELQKKEDLLNNERKSSRTCLSDSFIEAYCDDILEKFNFSSFIEEMGNKKVLFFCVEGNHLSCHRYLIKEHLSKLGFITYDL